MENSRFEKKRKRKLHEIFAQEGAHSNICSLRNKVHEIARICTSESIHVLALSATHLDSTIYDSELEVDGYRFHRRDRNKHGGGIALHVKHHIPVVLQSLMNVKLKI